MARKKPNVNIGSTQKKRDRAFFKNFVLEVIEDTFIYEFTPTSISLDDATQTKFTLELGPVDNTPGGGDGPDLGSDIYDDNQYFEGQYVQDEKDIKGYRFVYEDLMVSDSKDYLDVYLYGVKQIENYKVDIFDSNGAQLPDDDTTRNGVSIKIIFEESITFKPTEGVSRTDFEIKGKITEIV